MASPGEDEGRKIVLHPIQDGFIYGDWTRGLYTGEFGNGKTMSAAFRARRLSVQYPRNTGIVLRKTWGDNRDTTLKQFHEMFPTWEQYYLRSEHQHKLPNGSVIFWRGMDRIGRISQLTNYNLGWFWMEQAEEMLVDIFRILEGRLKLRHLPVSGWATSNPAGHNWCWKTFIAPGKDPKYTYFQPPARWNAANLAENYYEDKESSWPKSMINRYLNGLHEGYEGLLYDIFLDNTTPQSTAIDPIDLNPADVVSLMEGQDYGTSDTDPMVWYWAVRMRSGRCFIVDEIYDFQSLPHKVAPKVWAHRKLWEEKLGVKVKATYGCQRTFQHERDGRTPADQFHRDHGIIINQNNAHFEVRYPVAYRTMAEGNLKIFRTCKNLIGELESLTWELREDLPNHGIEAMERMIMKLVEYKQPEKAAPKPEKKVDAHLEAHRKMARDYENERRQRSRTDVRSLV